MVLLHFGIRGGMDGASMVLGLLVIIVGGIFFMILGIATNGFKHPHNQEKNDKQVQHNRK
jgi:hypothetical protein